MPAQGALHVVLEASAAAVLTVLEILHRDGTSLDRLVGEHHASRFPGAFVNTELVVEMFQVLLDSRLPDEQGIRDRTDGRWRSECSPRAQWFAEGLQHVPFASSDSRRGTQWLRRGAAGVGRITHHEASSANDDLVAVVQRVSTEMA